MVIFFPKELQSTDQDITVEEEKEI